MRHAFQLLSTIAIGLVAILAGECWRVGRAHAETPPPGLGEKADAGAEDIIIIVGDRSRAADKFGEDGEHRDRGALLASAPFLTVVHADEHQGATVGDALSTAVGARVSGLGGLGAFATLSVRGLAPGNTAVVIDGVPVSRLASVTVDVSQWDMNQFERAMLYRSGAPAQFGGGGGGGLGGALHLVSPVGQSEDGDRLAVLAGAGSWGARHLRAWYGDDASWGRFRANGGFMRSAGDFSYFNDRGTQLNPDDDVWQTRSNNDVAMGDLAFRAASVRDRSGTARTTWASGIRAAWRDQGLAGSTAHPAADTRLTTKHATLDVAMTHAWSPRWQLAATGYGTGEHQHYVDPAGEVGVGLQDRTYRTIATGAQAGLTRQASRYTATLALDARGERYADRDNLQPDHSVEGARAGLAATAQVAVRLADWLILEPSLRAERMRTSSFIDLDTDEHTAARVDWFATPRLAARVLVAPDLQCKASAGAYARSPTLLELFGDRGFIWGNPALNPETGQSLDAGFVWAPTAVAESRVDRVLLEAAVFVANTNDTIVWSSTNGYVIRPVNLGDATITGLELSGHARFWRRVGVAGNYTMVASAQRNTEPSYEGKPLPQRPRHQAYARVDVGAWRGSHPVVLSGDIAYTSGSYLDAAAKRDIPDRTFLGAGASVRAVSSGTHTLDIAIWGQNLTNRRVERVSLASPPSPEFSTVPRPVMDTSGYPLPGRTWMLSAAWHY